MSSVVTACSLYAAYIARRRRFSRRYTRLGMTLGTRVTLVTTTVIASVLAVSGYAALKVRRANLEADLGREAHEIAAALRAGLQPIEGGAAAAETTETLLRRVRAAHEHDDLFQLELLSVGDDRRTDDQAWL